MCLGGSFSLGASVGGPFLLSGTRIAEVRAALSVGEDEALLSDWREFREIAERILEAGQVYSVTFKETMAASGNPHDYFSTGPYWWPNPDTEDGLPYVRRDGEFNPSRDKISNRANLRSMVKETRVLTVAYALSGEERFAEHAARLVRVWFLDAATHMRPNLNHAQAIPGRVSGRGTGIIDSHVFIHLMDALRLLEGSAYWTATDAAGMRQWLGDFLDWLLAHPHGHHERQAANNHGTAYDFQVVSIALYLDRLALAHLILTEQTRARIGSQIDAAGRQPLELARTRSWSYCTENLRHFFWLARLGEHVDVDLYHFTAPGGGSLRGALEFLLPHACDPHSWPFEQVTDWSADYLREVLLLAMPVYPELSLPFEKVLDCLTSFPFLYEEARFLLRLL